ncbi:DUF6000 family protein [Micromonospora vinacea]|uniref:Tetracycline repressor TetR C-terminal domain-containing protein n=1 Tax=Micromonospora vinacea TaxID=709878 RepID=A0ABS0K3L8_9ACTN|nr:DUF6000 family protein [Micromonospora vinacea]MBG6103218.1 hypothetical protein [Micromonospora vinacea]WSZ74038.1 DUF6000 family protein [Micromonospora sp. NBC_00860]
MDQGDIDDVIDRCVVPFYLDMMGTNAVRHGQPLITALAEAGRGITPAQVTALLRDGWRPQVMGAWYSVTLAGPEVAAAVLHALATSWGALDAPPLATAAVVLAGPESIEALERYFAADQAAGWGASGIIAAAADHVRRHHHAATSLPAATKTDQETFAALLDVARRLQAASRGDAVDSRPA